MTWHYSVRDTTLDVWDHNSDPAEDPPTYTRESDNGFSWFGGRHPPEVIGVMYDATITAINEDRTGDAIRVLAEGAFERIERHYE